MSGISRRDFFRSLFGKVAGPPAPAKASVDNALCWSGQGRACDECVKACPESPKAITVSAVGLSAGVDAARCTGCGDCVKACPAKAIASLAR